MEEQEQNTSNSSPKRLNGLLPASGGHALNSLSTLFFYLAILFFIIGFNFTDTPPGPFWYQQFMPNLSGRQIVDITFTDSLNGYAITNRLSQTDTSFVLRTTSSGNTWFIAHSDSGVIYQKIQFINQNTGFVGGYIYAGGSFHILKTTNAGLSWYFINAPFDQVANGMFVLSEDTIWIVDSGSISGGIFLTTNGGASWTQQLSQGAANPDKIYMYNARIGYANRNGGSFMYHTTNGGLNWSQVAGTDGFREIYFADSLTGWKVFTSTKKSTDGGLTWVTLTLPSGGIIQSSAIFRFSNINRDTIWGAGGYVMYPNNETRGILYRTTNGGTNWLFQIPDTAIHVTSPAFINFVNRWNGWGYFDTPTGIHTTTGGDTIFLTPVRQISSEIPKNFKLFQNYPNPFNPNTVVSYQLRVNSFVKMIVYDMTGKHIVDLVNQKQTTGTYQVDFDGSNLSSGVYFYSLIVDGNLIDTKRMILLK